MRFDNLSGPANLHQSHYFRHDPAEHSKQLGSRELEGPSHPPQDQDTPRIPPGPPCGQDRARPLSLSLRQRRRYTLTERDAFGLTQLFIEFLFSTKPRSVVKSGIRVVLDIGVNWV